MSGEDRLRAALARDAQRQARASQKQQERQEKIRLTTDRQRTAEAKFRELKASAREAMSRLKPDLAKNRITVTEPSFPSVGDMFDRISFIVARDGQEFASTSVFGWEGGTITINGSEGSFEFDDPRLTTDFFYDRFTEIVANSIERSEGI
jgi:hypothetical protein